MGACTDLRRGMTLNGNLGLQEVVEMAFLSVDPNDAGASGPFSGPAVAPAANIPPVAAAPVRERGFAASGPRVRSAHGGGKSEGAFGTSIEFVITKAVGPAGPTWTLEHFKGPGGKLFTAQRADTHKVTISFSRKGEQDAKLQNQNLKMESLNSNIRSLRISP